MKNLANVPVRLVTNPEVPFSNLEEGWLVMQATRPIYGDQTIEYMKFTGGYFYAAIDLQGEFAAWIIEGNINLDAHILLFMSEEKRLRIGINLMPEKYRHKYAENIHKFQFQATVLDRLNGRTYGEIMEAAA